LNGSAEITKIEKLKGDKQTYTIVRLDLNHSFIANGIVVGTEQLRMYSNNIDEIK